MCVHYSDSLLFLFFTMEYKYLLSFFDFFVTLNYTLNINLWHFGVLCSLQTSIA